MDNIILTPSFKEILDNEGYFEYKEVNGKVYGLYKFAFTVGLMCDLKLDSLFGGMLIVTYKHRYCYSYANLDECLLALKVYEGIGDPIGSWVKQKGGGVDRVNPDIVDEWINS